MKGLQDLTDEQFEQVLRRAGKRGQQSAKALDKGFGRRVLEYITPDINTPSAYAQGAYNSATLGFAPQIASIAATPIVRLLYPELFENENFRETYKKGLEAARENRAAIEESNPISNTLGNLHGALTLPWPTKSIKGAAGYGGAYGATYGLASTDTGDYRPPLGIDANQAIEALKGGAIGAATGGLAQTLMNKIFPHVKPVDKKTQENIELARQFPKAPASKAELSRKNKHFLEQESAEKGRLGGGNQERMNEFKEIQKVGFKEEAERLRNDIGGTNEYTTKGEAAGQSIRSLQKEVMGERKQYSNLYNKATEGESTVNGKDVSKLPEILEQDFLERGLTTDNVPKVFGEINALKKILKKKAPEEKISSVLDQYGDKIVKEAKGDAKINIKEIQAWQQGLNRAIKESTVGGQEEFALKQLSRKVEGYMDGLIEKALIEGDTVALGQFRQAKQMASKWFEKYQAKNNGEFGKKFIEDIVDNARFSREPYSDEMLINKIFGASEMGFTPQSASIVKELKNLMTEKQFANIKLEAAQKLISPLLGETPNATAYLKNLNKFIRNNPTLVKELFSKSEIQDLIALGKHGKNIFTRPVSAMNPSGTANVLIEHLNQGKIKKVTSFIKNLGNKVELDQQKIQQALQKGERIPRTMPAALKASLIGGNSIINELSQKKNLQSLSDEQFEELEDRMKNK